MSKKQTGKVIWVNLTDEEARKQFGGSFMAVGRPISPIPRGETPKKTVKDVYQDAALALSLQFDPDRLDPEDI